MATTLRMMISMEATTNVYGRLRASRTIHIILLEPGNLAPNESSRRHSGPCYLDAKSSAEFHRSENLCKWHWWRHRAIHMCILTVLRMIGDVARMRRSELS